MIIGIDANEANVINRVGSNVYAFELLWQIYQIQKSKDKKCNLKFKIYLKDKPLDDLPTETYWWQYKVLKPTFLWTQWRLPLDLYFSSPKANLFFTLGHYAPRFNPSAQVISIMDLAFLRYPEQFRKKDLWQLTNWTKYSVEKSKHIFTISEFTKREIVYFYNYPPEQITVTYPGVNKNNKYQMPEIKNIYEGLRRKYNINANYFLYVGTLQPRKNLIRLIEAFNLTMKQFSAQGGTASGWNNEAIKLIIVGKKGWLYKDIYSKVEELKLSRQIVLTDFIAEKEKIALLKNALSLVLPSLYEGFGIPVLEAMNMGCPVVVSKNSSLPEIVGKSGLYIDDPYDVKSIQQSLVKMIKLNQKEREFLIKKGFEQIKKFSWEESGKKTAEVLCSLLKIKMAEA